MLQCILIALILTVSITANVHPIIIHGHYFIDSITKEPVCNRQHILAPTLTNQPTVLHQGIDYQPGGSSAVSELNDPLSDPDKCARDIILFQELGINTIRIYSINAHLNHDKCMTMLAKAEYICF